jgi:hypothetical protein
VSVAGAAEQTAAVDDVTLGGDAVSLLHVGNERADLHDIARELVSNRERRLAAAAGPRVPVVDVNVGTAYAGAANTYENFVVAHLRLRNILELESFRSGFFHQRFQIVTTPLCAQESVTRARFTEVMQVSTAAKSIACELRAVYIRVQLRN